MFINRKQKLNFNDENWADANQLQKNQIDSSAKRTTSEKLQKILGKNMKNSRIDVSKLVKHKNYLRNKMVNMEKANNMSTLYFEEPINFNGYQNANIKHENKLSFKFNCLKCTNKSKHKFKNNYGDTNVINYEAFLNAFKYKESNFEEHFVNKSYLDLDKDSNLSFQQAQNSLNNLNEFNFEWKNYVEQLNDNLNRKIYSDISLLPIENKQDNYEITITTEEFPYF